MSEIKMNKENLKPVVLCVYEKQGSFVTEEEDRVMWDVYGQMTQNGFGA